jgi:ubiquinone/menaquinone biosynthesis C-methylase UbiE
MARDWPEDALSFMSGSERTRRFYDDRGWKKEQGATLDQRLFGPKELGPIRVALQNLHIKRLRDAAASPGSPLSLLECGCGGNPRRELLSVCSHYTGVDFSTTGLEVARASFADAEVPHEFRLADICNLPFQAGTFDVAYSAHVIYHLDDPAAQELAIAEMLRVVRPGGVVILITANPRPLAFPGRMLRRMVADTPVLGPWLNRLRTKQPLPFKPMTLRWMRQQLERGGPVEQVTAGIATVDFYQHVSEFKPFGRLLWKSIAWLDVNFPRLAVYCGNYVMLVCRKRAEGPAAT